MITLDQIRGLELKVQRAVAYIAELKEENSLLQKNLEKYRGRIDELEVLINTYKEDQNEIEQGVVNALFHLDKLEDDISRSPDARAQASESPPALDDIESAVIHASAPSVSAAHGASQIPAGEKPSRAEKKPRLEPPPSETKKPADELEIF